MRDGAEQNKNENAQVTFRYPRDAVRRPQKQRGLFCFEKTKNTIGLDKWPWPFGGEEMWAKLKDADRPGGGISLRPYCTATAMLLKRCQFMQYFGEKIAQFEESRREKPV